MPDFFTLWTPGPGFTADKVGALQRQLKAPLKVLTTHPRDVEKYAEPIELVTPYPRWWSKHEMYRHSECGVYFDLDTIIVNGFRDFEPDDGFWALRDVYQTDTHDDPICQFSVYTWKGDYDWIRAAVDDLAKWGGVQWNRREGAWLDWHIKRHNGRKFLQDAHPGVFRSYKEEAKDGIPKGCKVVFFHGDPRPWDAPGWPRTFYLPVA